MLNLKKKNKLKKNVKFDALFLNYIIFSVEVQIWNTLTQNGIFVKMNVIALPLNKWKEKKITLNLDFNILRSLMIQ